MTDLREKLLFVDDEEMVLRAMRRILQVHADQWDMVFVNSGAEALRLLAADKYDTVISDVRMPGMNGAELLGQVAGLYPDTIRIALSGYADRELMLQCAGVAHQYLAKPCEAEVLKAVLQRLTVMVRARKDVPIRQLLARCPHLPTVSDVYSRLVEMLNNAESSIEDIGEIIAQDVAMSTQVLKLVNSAFFGLGRNITHPAEATLFLGIDTIRLMVLSTNLFQPVVSRQTPGFSIPRLWSHSLACGDAAKTIAESLGGDRQVVNEAFVAGLLHDIGRLLLCANLPDEYGQVLELARRDHLTLCAAEQAVLGADHAEIGGYYLGLLGLPISVVDAVTYHHRPSAATDMASIPLTALHIGNSLAGGETVLSFKVPASPLDETFIAARGLEENIRSWRHAWLNRPAEKPAG